MRFHKKEFSKISDRKFAQNWANRLETLGVFSVTRWRALVAKALKNFIRSWLYQEDIKAKVRHVEVDKFGLLLLHNFPHHFPSLAIQRKIWNPNTFAFFLVCFLFKLGPRQTKILTWWHRKGKWSRWVSNPGLLERYQGLNVVNSALTAWLSPGKLILVDPRVQKSYSL